MTWVVAPVAGYVLWLQRRVTENTTSIAVQDAEIKNLREMYGREIKDIKVTMDRIYEKLDGIEQSLRK